MDVVKKNVPVRLLPENLFDRLIEIAYLLTLPVAVKGDHPEPVKLLVANHKNPLSRPDFDHSGFGQQPQGLIGHMPRHPELLHDLALRIEPATALNRLQLAAQLKIELSGTASDCFGHR